MPAKPLTTNRFRFLPFVLGIIIILGFTLLLTQLLMAPPLGDLVYLLIYLGLTSIISAGFGFISNRLGWWRKLHHLSTALILGYIIAGVLTLINVWITAKLMFINEHDFLLSTILLIFAGGISVTFGFFLSQAITSELQELVQGADRISSGDFSTRVPVNGNDEIAQLSEAFNQMALQLERASTIEKNLEDARRNLVAWASHDLRTPLTTIRAMLESILDGVVTDPETVNRYIKQSQREIEQMSILIEDLFELAQLDAGYKDFDFEWITVSDLVSDTLESFTAKATQQEIHLSGSVDSEANTLWAAPDKLSRILDNLVSNALRYTKPGGEVRIDVSAIDHHIQFRVSDSGSGIPRDEIDLIFDRFYHGDKSRVRHQEDYPGVGLGLAIVKGLVEAHNASIDVNSLPGKGTTFILNFPKIPK